MVCSNLPGLDKDFLAQDLGMAIQGQVGVKWEGSSHVVNLSTLTLAKTCSSGPLVVSISRL